ncbi:hypothetical protein Hypma_012359 [Hypsizygus marmoreus]|uniref:Uncharacterized protein n=1 Tax=Hypsizygus marmoreus TaxID=39966 RepID=A0A369K9A0_HYPMA|nr:hypothetical protein Hypma_012359 [Hypsizygus marmoreus]
MKSTTSSPSIQTQTLGDGTTSTAITVAEQPMGSAMMKAVEGGEKSRESLQIEQEPARRIRGGCICLPCAWPLCCTCCTAMLVGMGIMAAEK